MPGIFGLILQSPASGDRHEHYRQVLDQMSAAMLYEPFFVCRQFDSSRNGVFAAWVGIERAGATLPAATIPELGVTVLAAGEPRCAAPEHAEWRNWAGPDPRSLRRIVAHYQLAPHVFPAPVAGLCAGLVIDEARGESLLFNDRYGMERLFVYQRSDAVFFASEAKAILAAAPETRALDGQGLAEFLTCGGTINESSLFRGIRVLPAGSLVRFRRGGVPQPRPYFDRSRWETAPPLPADEFEPLLHGELKSAVRRDVEPSSAAVSLTGGLDSRMLMGCLEAPPGSVPCYTFGSMYRETHDVQVARRVAAACRQDYHVLSLDAGFLAALPQYFERSVYTADGTLGLSGAAELYVNERARRIAPIRVTGNYGGELLRGVRAFGAAEPAEGIVQPEFAPEVSRAVHSFSRLAAAPPLSFTLFCQAPSGFGRYAIERSQVTVRSPFLDEHVVETLYRRPALSDGHELSLWILRHSRPDLMSIPTDRGALGSGGLRAGVRRLQRECSFKAEYWTGYGAPSWLSRLTRKQPLAALERAFIARHKFVHPRVWFRGELGAFACDVLGAQRHSDLAAFVDVRHVKALAEQDRRDGTNHWDVLDKVLTLAIACGRLLNPPARPTTPPRTGLVACEAPAGVSTANSYR